MGVFRERVLFAQPQDTSNLSKFAARVREAMSAAGLRVADGRKEFRPHCTLVKLDRGLCRTVPEIDRAHYTSYINTRCVGVVLGDSVRCDACGAWLGLTAIVDSHCLQIRHTADPRHVPLLQREP